jgi:N-methylhydantoinase B/oxoprolinase/acetone carboxylase alpha subunit
MIRQNVRTPDQTLGDLWAQVVALDLMEDRLLALMENYALPDLADLAREIQGRCETAMRSAIAALPDGAPLRPCRTAPTAASCRPTGCWIRPSPSAWR